MHSYYKNISWLGVNPKPKVNFGLSECDGQTLGEDGTSTNDFRNVTLQVMYKYALKKHKV